MRLFLMLGLLQSGCVIQKSLSRDEVMEQIAPQFPVEARKSLFYVRLQNPDIRFPGGNKLDIRLEAEAGAPGILQKGHATVEGKVDYRGGAIFLKDPVVLELDLGLELPAEWKPHVQLAVETALLATLTEKPIYQIHDQRVKKVWVERERLMLEIRL
jgi:hypothetical protein